MILKSFLFLYKGIDYHINNVNINNVNMKGELLMNIKHVILGFLLEEPMSGYDLKGKIENSVSYFFDASFGAIYPALKRLEKEKLIYKQIIQQDGKPNKNLFAITEQGREEFLRYIESPLHPTLIRSDLLIRIFFGRHTSREKLIEWLLVEKQRASRQAEHLKSLNEKYPEMDRYRKITLLYGIDEAQFTLEWINKELASLEKEEER
jgi:DNA-binding PadR family transcriptional regulator